MKRPLAVRHSIIPLTTTTAKGLRVAAPGVARRDSSERHQTIPLLMAPMAMLFAAALALAPPAPSPAPATGPVAAVAPAPLGAVLPPDAGGVAWPLQEHRAARGIAGRHEEILLPPKGGQTASRIEVPLPPLIAMRPPEEAPLLAPRPRPAMRAPSPAEPVPTPVAPPAAPPSPSAVAPPQPPPTLPREVAAAPIPAPRAPACHGSVGRLLGGKVPPVASPLVGRLDPHGFGLALAAAARSQLGEFVVYSATYRRLAYPMGDVSPLYGVCTDVVLRAYRALGIDLQELVHKSRSGVGDASIDHRRVDVLRVFLARHGTSLPVSDIAEDYRPGDIVTYWRPQNRSSNQHVAVVTDLIAPSGRPMIVHNRGWGPQLEDALFVDRITGHYRFAGMRQTPGEVPAPAPPAVAATGKGPQAPPAGLMQRRAVFTQSAMPGRPANPFAR